MCIGKPTYTQVIEASKDGLRCVGVILANDRRDPSRRPIQDLPINSPILSLPRMYHAKAIWLMAVIAGSYHQLADPDEAKRWVQAMVWADQMVFGTSLDLFKEMNKSHIDAFKIEQYL